MCVVSSETRIIYAVEFGTTVQGHPRLLILVAIDSAYMGLPISDQYDFVF